MAAFASLRQNDRNPGARRSDQYPELASPDLRKMGVAVIVRNDSHPPRGVVLLMLEWAGCH